MASPNSTFTEMVTTTLRNRSKKVADNVSNHNALYRRMMQRNKMTKQGGREIVLPLDYAENSTYQRISGYDTFDISASDVLSAAKYDWVQAVVVISASGRELRMNRGPEQLINLVRARVKNAERTAANQMATDLYSSGSLSNQMGGLAHIIQDNGQGTVGGINSATYTFWRNKFREIIDTDGTSGDASADNIRFNMNALDLELTRGTDRPDLIVSSHDLYSMYWNSLTDQQRYGDTNSAGSNFQSLKFKGTDVIFDNNDNFATTAEKMYFLNTDYLYLCEHPDAQWSPEEKRISINQDAEIVPMFWMGQLCCSNRSLQGVLIDAVDS